MADDARESKAQKLAAARRKLKEYQNRGADHSGLTTSTMTTSSTSVASSERSECENSVEGSIPNFMNDNSNGQIGNLSNYFNAPMQETAFAVNISEQLQQQQQPQQQVMQHVAMNNENVILNDNASGNLEIMTTTTPFQLNEQFQQQQQQQQQQQLNAMQLLINEKTQLSAELNRWRSLCHDKEAALEDLRTLLNAKSQEFEDFQYSFKQQQQSTEQLRKLNAELMHKLSQANAAHEDQTAHLMELQQQLKLTQNQFNELEQKFNDKCKEYELAQLRIQQISDNSNSGKDERVESVTQNQFMYEQQIRDLQAMVQQFTQDKEQSSIQYQNYVQHLNAEVAKLNEKNSDLNDTCVQLQERERQLVEHISELEREIQKNLSLRQTAVENQTPKSINVQSQTSQQDFDALKNQISTLEERLSDYDFERHQFQLKIKSQEDRLEELQVALNEKEETLSKLTEHLPDQHDQVKLLAAMESDKIAASRALNQNIKLKAQLDEMEMRFVQLTNDKAELTIQLDKETFEKRAMLTKMEEMEIQLKNLDEKFQNKDEEMIRLSHENMELIERLKQYEVKNSSNDVSTAVEAIDEHDGHHHEHHDHNHHHHHNDDNNSHDEKHVCEHEHTHDTAEKTLENHFEMDKCQEAHEVEVENNEHKKQVTPHIAKDEAVEKLQARFTYLISQLADVTDEKQRLEHLVLQLQDETETIGEYIALYQTQRRILKQREYEKAAQTRLLHEEREKLREKVAQLNELVLKLGLLEKTATTTANEMSASNVIKAQLQAALAESVSIEPHNDVENNQQNDDNNTIGDNVKKTLAPSFVNDEHAMPLPGANELLMQIQNIVTEIKENTTRDLPLLDAKTNNAIEICHCCEGQLKIV